MVEYRFCVASRRSDGRLDAPVHEEVVAAENTAAAITQARDIDVDMAGLKANAVYLLDAGGYVVWSLRAADISAEPEEGSGDGRREQPR